jgi:hypothetical protein
MLNIATLAVAATAALHLKSADGEALYDGDKPVRIVVHGPGSRAYGVVEGRQTARAVKRMNENEGKVTTGTTEERRAETAEDLAAITIAFEGFTYGDGKLQGEELFRAVYADPALGFITKQVTKFVGDWSNFKQGSVAT